MRSIPAALTWELFERGKWNMLGAFLSGNALPMILLAALRREGAIDPEDRSMITIHVTMLLINASLFGGALCAAIGKPSRLFAFPAPTSVLVAWQLLPAMVALALETLLSTAVFNAMFELDWPLWGPALFVSVGLAMLAACVWATDKSPWYTFVLGTAVAVVVGLWFYSRYGIIFRSQSVRMWREVTVAEVATMLMMAGVAYYVAVVGVTRSRCGEFLKTPAFFHWLAKLLDPAPDVGLPFRSPAQAQFWFEWRQKGWGIPGLVIVAFPVGFVLWLMFNRNPHDLFDVALGTGGFLAPVGLIVGMMFGNVGPADGRLDMGHFLATRPMTSTDMARTMLEAAGFSVLLAWVLWAAAFLVLYAILLIVNVDPRPQIPSQVGWWYFPATLLGTWLALTFMATIALAGRTWLFVNLFCVIPAVAVGAMVFSHYVLSPAERTAFGQCVMAAVGVIFIFGTAWAFVAARRRALIGWQTVWVALGIWTALCLLGALYWSQHRLYYATSPLPALVHAVGLLALVVFPLAAAPLALVWNRNR